MTATPHVINITLITQYVRTVFTRSVSLLTALRTVKTTHFISGANLLIYWPDGLLCAPRVTEIKYTWKPSSYFKKETGHSSNDTGVLESDLGEDF